MLVTISNSLAKVHEGAALALFDINRQMDHSLVPIGWKCLLFSSWTKQSNGNVKWASPCIPHSYVP